MTKKSSLIFFFTFIAVVTAVAQTSVIKLWKEIPGSIKNKTYIEKGTFPESNCISKITDPELHVFVASPEKSTGSAVLVIPGGGYGTVCIGHEGFEVAKWFNAQGITAIVLKYRLPSDEIMKDKSIGPLQDAQEAMRVIRRNATKWKIDPHKVGVLGFSAGGHLASTLSTQFSRQVYNSDNSNARPDFSILIYPVISFDDKITHQGSKQNLIGKDAQAQQVQLFSNDLQVSAQTPMAFLVHSQDDKAVPVENNLRYSTALTENKVPYELHIYKEGGHGYGLAKENAGTESLWPAACEQWLKKNGF